jgi:hypothetical protein
LDFRLGQATLVRGESLAALTPGKRSTCSAVSVEFEANLAEMPELLASLRRANFAALLPKEHTP